MVALLRVFGALVLFVTHTTRAELTVDDLDLFDIVEDVKQNFYELLEIPENATTADIRKAYRRLSLQYHPDRNPDPEAPEKFRKIAAVMEVLRDERKRNKYHEVLQYGIPDWARSMYYRYYRRARKMGLAEMTVMMSIIITVAQTLWMWASYWEKRFTINSNIDEAIKRKKQRSTNAKKNKTAEEEILQLRQELMSHVKAPALQDIWFVRLPVAIFYLALALPSIIRASLSRARELSDKCGDSDSNNDERPVKQKRAPRQREPVKAAQVACVATPVVNVVNSNQNVHPTQQELKTGNWSDNEVASLLRLLKKYPVGTLDRWEQIGVALNRSSVDVSGKVKSLRNISSVNVPTERQNTTKTLWVESEISTKESGSDEENGEADDDDPAQWTQAQQKQLELAMVAFPKYTERRWDLIADRIDGKSKKACVARVKWLIEAVKHKRVFVDS